MSHRISEDDLSQELNELNRLLSEPNAVRNERVRELLKERKDSVETAMQQQQQQQQQTQSKPTKAETTFSTKPMTPKEPPRETGMDAASGAVQPSEPKRNIRYQPIESFSWEQDPYPGEFVTVFIPMKGIGAKVERDSEALSCDFGETYFDLKIRGGGSNGENVRLYKNNLEKPIVPEESEHRVKNNKIVLKLKKAKGEYGTTDHWIALTSKKGPKSSSLHGGKAKKEDDPAAGIMEMMKDLYDSGDSETRKVLGEAMLKSRQEQGQQGMGGLGSW